MQMTYDQLMETAKKGDTADREQRRINKFNSAAAKAGLKALDWKQYLTVNASYYKNHYGKYAAAATGFTLAAVYLVALVANPALIPFGLAALTGYLKYVVGAAFLAFALYTGSILAPRTYAEFNNLRTRFDEKELSNHDMALLASTAVLGTAFVGVLHLFPTMLPVIGSFGTMAKLAIDAVVAVPTVASIYAMFKGRPAAAPASAPEQSAEVRKGLDLHNEGSEAQLESGRRSPGL